MVRLMFKRLLLVQLVVSSIAVLGNTIDSMIVARMLGTNAIAACGLLNPFAILTAAISGVISSGTQMVCSKSIGAGENDTANKQLGAAFAASITISVAIVALGYLFMDQFCLILGAHPGTQLFSDTKDYARGLLASFIPAIPSALTMFTCVSNGDLKRCRIAGISIVCLNVVLSIASILVFHGGLFGVGLASSLSAYLVLFYLLGHFKKKDLSLKPSFSGMKWGDFGQIVIIGSPRAAFKVCTFLLILMLNNVLVDFYSYEYVAAYSIVRNIYGIASFTTSALLYSTSLVTSVFYGEANRRALHDTVGEFIRLSFVTGIAGSAFLFVFGPALALLFLNPGTNVYEITCSGLAIISLSLPFCSAVACLQNFFIGTGHQGWGVAFNVIAVLVLIPAAGFSLMPAVGAKFVFAAFPLGYLLELILIAAFVALRAHRNPLRTGSYLFVPDDFGVAVDRELTFEICERDDLAKSKEQFEQFCASVDCGDVEDRSFRALSLFANSCMEHKEGNKGEACYARAYCKDGALNLIIWNTFGLVVSNPSPQGLQQTVRAITAKLSGPKPEHSGVKCDASTSKGERHHDAQLDADLAELLAGCKYSVSSPFGFERLLITFEAANNQGTENAAPVDPGESVAAGHPAAAPARA